MLLGIGLHRILNCNQERGVGSSLDKSAVKTNKKRIERKKKWKLLQVITLRVVSLETLRYVHYLRQHINPNTIQKGFI